MSLLSNSKHVSNEGGALKAKTPPNLANCTAKWWRVKWCWYMYKCCISVVDWIDVLFGILGFMHTAVTWYNKKHTQAILALNHRPTLKADSQSPAACWNEMKILTMYCMAYNEVHVLVIKKSKPWQYVCLQGCSVTEASSSLHITHFSFSFDTVFTCFCKWTQHIC